MERPGQAWSGLAAPAPRSEATLTFPAFRPKEQSFLPVYMCRCKNIHIYIYIHKQGYGRGVQGGRRPSDVFFFWGGSHGAIV